jgi:hypothetical protein
MCDIGWWSNVVEMARMNASSYEGRTSRETTREFQFALLHVDGARNNDVDMHGSSAHDSELEWNIDVQMNTTEAQFMDGLQDGVSLLIDSVHAISSLTARCVKRVLPPGS